jgi:hypothetical protein
LYTRIERKMTCDRARLIGGAGTAGPGKWSVWGPKCRAGKSTVLATCPIRHVGYGALTALQRKRQQQSARQFLSAAPNADGEYP